MNRRDRDRACRGNKGIEVGCDIANGPAPRGGRGPEDYGKRPRGLCGQ